MPIKTKAVIIGSGATGLFAARLLHNLTFVHDLSSCNVPDFHHLTHQASILNHNLPLLFKKRSGKTPSGQWFDSFLYHEAQKNSCLTAQDDSKNQVDWLLLSNQGAGGSWNSYDDNQRTISPYAWMEIPGFPISSYLNKRYASLSTEREKTDALSLRAYFEAYQASLPQKRLHLDHQVLTIDQHNDDWIVTVKHKNKIDIIQTTYLVLAIGQTQPKLLNIPGEQLPFVTHTSAHAIDIMRKLPKQSQILVVGTGLSASDVITQAWQQGHHVSHLVSTQLLEQQSQYTSLSSSRKLMHTGNLQLEYPHQYQVKTAMLYPDHFKHCYTQYKDYHLTELTTQKHSILQHITHSTVSVKIDHAALLLGYQPDYSALPYPLNLRTTQDYDHNTLEVTGYSNLFLAGSCTGDWFQRFFLGHAFYVAETIKAREKNRSVNTN